MAPAWIGAQDQDQEGEWRWLDDGSQFWSGDAFGTSVAESYSNWYFLQPSDFFNQDCAVHKRHVNAWRDEACFLHFDFVCEAMDTCPDDSNKLEPGICGCGSVEDDTDGDGSPDCVDECPYDSTQTSEGSSGCGTTVPACTGELSDLVPRFECVLEKPDGVHLVVFGVDNRASCVVEAPLGPTNGFIDGAIERGQPSQFLVGLGSFVEFVTGSRRVPIDFDILNRDPSFDPNKVMQRAWGKGVGSELSLSGAKVEIFQSLPLRGALTSHRGYITSSGKVDIEVAKGPDLVGICVHMENDAAMISSGITENEQCTFADNFGLFLGDDLDVVQGPVPPGGRYVLTVNHSDANYLTQITDARAYAHDVMELDPKQAEVSVGAVADTFGEFQDSPRAFVGCFDYSEMSHALLASSVLLGAIVPVAGPVIGGLGLFSHPFIAKDIFLPSGENLKGSRNTVTHEYGHFVMCDIVSDDVGELLNLYMVRTVDEGLGETLPDDAGLAMESFADFLASQVSGGTNYFATVGAHRGAYSGCFCIEPQCLEYNYRRVPGEPSPTTTDEYREEIRRRVSLYHDAVDRSSSVWRSENIPGNVDAWRFQNLQVVINTTGSYLESVDEGVEMSGAGIASWISRSSGGSYAASRFEEGLVDQLYDEGHSWCQVCNLFALHDADVAPTATLQEKWAACRDGLVIEHLQQAPQADLRLSAATCEICPARQVSDSEGVCTTCPGLRDVVVGNGCVGCPRGEIAVADGCVSCADDEVVAGNECVHCGALHTASRLGASDACIACPIDQTIDLATFSPSGACDALVSDIGRSLVRSLATYVPSALCSK